MGNIPVFKIKLEEGANAPTRNHSDDAGWDLYAYKITEFFGECEKNDDGSVTLMPGARVAVDNGFCLALEHGWEAQIRPRSGLARKHGLMVTNSPGTVDAGYRGPIGTLITNTSTKPQTIVLGTRIAQMVFKPVYDVSLMGISSEDFDKLSTERGSKGFGSSGVN